MSKKQKSTQKESRRQTASQQYRDSQEKQRKYGAVYRQEKEVYDGGKTGR
jgi:hypothetical protein